MSEAFGIARTLGIDASEHYYLEILYLLNYPTKATSVFQSWLQSPFLRTQLFGLFGLHTLDPVDFRRVAPRYVRNLTPIWDYQGCVGWPATVSDVAWNIGTGSYRPGLEWDRESFHKDGHFIPLTKDTACFSIGKIGTEQVYTRRYKAFRAALLSDDALENCTALLASTDWIDRLYGLLGLRLTDRAAFARALPRVQKQCNQVPHKESFLHVARGYAVAWMPLLALLVQIEYATWDYFVLQDLARHPMSVELTQDQRVFWIQWFIRLYSHAFRAGECFTVGGTGYGGIRHPGYQKLLATLRQRDAARSLQKQLLEKTEVERLYALLGLRQIAVAPNPQLAIALSYEVCFELRGCLIEFTTPSRVRECIEAGLYDKQVQYDLHHLR